MVGSSPAGCFGFVDGIQETAVALLLEQRPMEVSGPFEVYLVEKRSLGLETEKTLVLALPSD